MKRANIIASVWIILGIMTVVFGQRHTENKADQVLRGSGRVNASTLGMEMEIPLGAYSGRGINVPVNLSYSSKLWRMDYVTNQPQVNNPDNCISINQPRYGENSASGWTTSLATPYIEYTGYDNKFTTDGFPHGSEEGLCQTNPPPMPPAVMIKRITIHLPGGETHELRDESGSLNGDFPASFDGTYYAADGSNLKYIQNSLNNTRRLLMPDGSFYDFVGSITSLNLATIRKASKFSDRNGNFTTYNDTNGSWTDTLGRVLTAPIGLTAPESPVTQTYSMPGMTGTYKFYWKKLKDTTAAESGLTNFNQPLKYWGDKYRVGGQYSHYETREAGTYLFESVENNWVIALDTYFNPVVLTQIELPTGQSYKFGYDVFGRIERMYYPTGGEERFAYSVVPQLSYVDPEDINFQTNFGVTNRKVYQTAGQGTPYEWQYSVSVSTPGEYKVSISNPDNTRAERYLYRSSLGGNTLFGYDSALMGMAYREDIFSNTDQLVSQKLTNWTVTQFSNGSAYPKDWHPRVASEETRIYDSSNNGVSATIAYEYDGDLNQRETPVLMKKSSQYPFVTVGSALPSTPVRTSETTFLINDANYPQWVKDLYLGQNMIGLATSVVVKDGAGTVVSRSEMRYDDSGYSPNIGRGNPTTSRVWDSTKGSWDNPDAYISTRAKFDIYGNQYEAIDARGISTLTEFDSTYHAFPVRTTSAVPDPGNTNGSNTAFETTATFNTTNGLPLTTTDANGLETRIQYDASTLRPVNTKTFYQGAQVGGMSETIYHDEPNNYWIKSRTLIDTGKWAESITYFDGLGRAYKTEEVDSQGNIFVEKEFDEDGRVKRVTNPFRTNEAKIWTTNVYDESSRLKEVVLPDGAKVKTDYGVSTASGFIGVTKTITDQAGKKRKGISDALGRMIRVVEDPDGQNLNTDYVFDTLGNLRRTIQGEQNRYFTYNSLGRLLYAKQPEQEANTAFAYIDTVTNNSAWSVKYEYDDNGNITKTTDAQGVYVQGTYDNFNRLKTRDYSDSTPDVSFYYDGRGLDSVPAFSKGKMTKVTSPVSETRYTSFDNLGRLLTYQQITGGQTYNFGYQYNLTALVAETYPSGRKISYEFDADGDLSRVAGQTANGAKTYANSFNYNSSGAIESLRLGNGKWETAVYNNRQQITQIGLGTSSVDTSLLKLEYGYGTNTQNNGSLRTQKISFNGLSQPFEQVYSYDDLNRLLSAEEKVNSQTTWKQTFSYDRYGNRRFDANNTTTLANSNNVTNPTIDTATNRFSAGQNYSYDKNGNLTADAGGKQFLYDGENHQKEVKDAQNQTVAMYHYDGEGRRIKKVLINSGQETIFVYNVSGQLAAEYVTNPESQIEPASTKYLTADHLGSPRIITDANGSVTSRRDYMAFGEETSTSQRVASLGYQPANEVRQGYTGYEQDTESGLDFAQARYYNSAHGRFTSVDPLTASANVKNPQTFNRYSYVLNSPYKFTDPLGLISSSTGANGQNSDVQDKPRRKKKPSTKQTSSPPLLTPDPTVVVPANVQAEASQTTVSASQESSDGTVSEDVTLVLPDSMVALKVELANFAYTHQASATNQAGANKKTGSIFPNQGTVSESKTTSQTDSATSSKSAELNISTAPGLTSSVGSSDTTTNGTSDQTGNQLSGPSADIRGNLNNIEVQTNKAIQNYLNANVDLKGNLQVQTINGQGNRVKAVWSRNDAERHLITFVQRIRNQADTDFGGN
ncbi:MAG TPA: RHS repeat-associated core domain-containing protein [Pyrinomonadaceae bacterium]|nr:RHS repeat-associated core domain-containing protein [Pyrinomonadaceae bacterium]